jgi:hypothetical protein
VTARALVDALEKLAGIGVLGRIRPQRVARERGVVRGGGAHSAHVAHHDGDAPVRERHEVVEVAAHGALSRGRDVVGDHAEPREPRNGLREQAALVALGRLACLFVELLDLGRAPDVLGDVGVDVDAADELAGVVEGRAGVEAQLPADGQDLLDLDA